MQETNEAVRAQDIENLEQSIESLKGKIQRKDRLVRLEKNKDFKEIITEGFFETHAIRQVMLKSHPGLQEENTQKGIENQMLAIGGLKQFFVAIYNEGLEAEQALAEDEATLEELLAEDIEGSD